MAIDIVKNIIEHSDEEIIEFLYEEITDVYSAMRTAIKAEKPELCLVAYCRLADIYNVLKVLDRRNKERGIK